MLSKPRKNRIVAILTSCIFCFLVFSFWPRVCSSPLQHADEEFIFYFTEQEFSDDRTLPELSSQQWIIASNSDEYKKILDIIGSYRYHLTFPLKSKDNHTPWMTIYTSDGSPILTCTGTNYIEIAGVAYSIYGRENNGSDMVKAILSYLQSIHA